MRTTIKKAIERIKDPCLRNFIKSLVTNDYFNYHIDGDLFEIIEMGFHWDSKKEGAKFWSAVFNNLKYNRDSTLLDKALFEFYNFKYEKGTRLISDKVQCYYFSNVDDEGDVLTLNKSILTVVGLFLHETGVYQVCQKGHKLYYFKSDVVNTFRPFGIIKKVELATAK
jgi:hypothetical protein